jgi:tetratricopeptide (TPR) repeat protein
MKKLLGLCGILFCLLLSVNSSFAFDKEKLQAVSEIGTLSNSQKYILALDKCNAALEKYPFDSELYYWKATINIHLGEGEQALKDMDMAIDLNPNDSNVYVMRGILKSELGDNEGALADFEQAIKVNPKNSSAFSMRACVKIAKGEFKSANEDLETANKLLEEEEKDAAEQKGQVEDQDANIGE